MFDHGTLFLRTSINNSWKTNPFSKVLQRITLMALSEYDTHGKMHL